MLEPMQAQVYLCVGFLTLLLKLEKLSDNLLRRPMPVPALQLSAYGQPARRQSRGKMQVLSEADCRNSNMVPKVAGFGNGTVVRRG